MLDSFKKMAKDLSNSNNSINYDYIERFDNNDTRKIYKSILAYINEFEVSPSILNSFLKLIYSYDITDLNYYDILGEVLIRDSDYKHLVMYIKDNLDSNCNDLKDDGLINDIPIYDMVGDTEVNYDSTVQQFYVYELDETQYAAIRDYLCSCYSYDIKLLQGNRDIILFATLLVNLSKYKLVPKRLGLEINQYKTFNEDKIIEREFREVISCIKSDLNNEGYLEYYIADSKNIKSDLLDEGV